MANKTYNWIWKWHFIGGLVSFPVIFVLALTGIIYLFKDYYEKPVYQDAKTVSSKGKRISYQQQLEMARQQWDRQPTAMVLPASPGEATEFVSGRFSNKSSLYINPYTGDVTGNITVKETDMYVVRRLHGELLMGSFGTKLVELTGSWMVVLILTGLFLFWPRKWKDIKKLWTIRINGPRRVMFRDMHMVSGFWFSLILLIMLAGGLPWTDVFGNMFSWVQKQTNTGYPATWYARGLTSTVAEGEPIPLDAMVARAQELNLPGSVTIGFPRSENGVFSISNRNHKDLSTQVMIHFDQYSGEQVLAHTWEDVGVLMRARMWAMAFHQGELGLWNWLLVIVTAGALMLLSLFAVVAYFLRKKPGSWGVPHSASYKVTTGFYVIVIILGVLLPVFGMSIILIWLYERLRQIKLGKLHEAIDN